MTAQQSFAVYLTEEASIDDGDHLQADTIDFYDSGVWVSHAGGRDFFPYERVLRIRDGAADADAGADTAPDVESVEDDQPTGERRDASSGTAGTVDDTQLDVE
ncbi:hypothetical protein [Haloplanus aerogenes]|uniref:Uncharacterized protein n=1 Tax=Haloplanus aerogenes TaxID=660522 RepID=A0A3M0DU60_9EURY|nr:hypothetical protein [Haloplanus aerogenes]AZH24180.1 hypothetical protein DU502_01775 [Haloplanus aerogenes]RMB24200.1 hypothetical protein ATH50_1441 [Haloplanus aerogenes]